jgi:glycosyltransferase involved in cell wall biosynthesis
VAFDRGVESHTHISKLSIEGKVQVAKKTVIVIAPASSLTSIPYGSRLASLFETKDIDVEFWGWDRENNASCPTARERFLLRGGGQHNRKLALYYVAWIWVTFAATLRRTRGGSEVFAIGTFSTIGTLAACLLRRAKLVYINSDNLSLSYRLPQPLGRLIGASEGLLARLATVHVVPSSLRWTGATANLVVAKNTPTRAIVAEAKRISLERGYQRHEPLTLYVNGWLTETRGMQMIVEATKDLDRRSFRLLVAGSPLCDAATRLLKSPVVEYMGRLTREEAFALYYRAHLVATFYDPSIPINRLAEANKWYECIIAHTPFVVNEEVLTARTFREAGACFTIPYGDACALGKLLEELTSDRTRLLIAERNISGLKCSVMEDEYEPVFRALSRCEDMACRT